MYIKKCILRLLPRKLNLSASLTTKCRTGVRDRKIIVPVVLNIRRAIAMLIAICDLNRKAIIAVVGVPSLAPMIIENTLGGLIIRMVNVSDIKKVTA